MVTGILLFLIFLLRALWIWRTAPAPMTAFEPKSEEIAYRHATTPLRHCLVMLGSCFFFAAIASFLVFAVAFLLWSSFLFNRVDHSGSLRFVFFLLFGLTVLGLSCTPKVKQLFTEGCLFFQRYQFFPPLPSRCAESLVEQLEKFPVGTFPAEVSQVLSAGELGEPDEEIYRSYFKLESVYGALARIAENQIGLTHRMYFRREWEMIDSQFRAIETRMNSNAGEVSGNLQQKISTCLYYAYNLLTRYIVENSASSLEVKQRFRACGFDVRL